MAKANCSIEGDVARIAIRGREGVRAYALVDKELLVRLGRWSWHLDNGYAVRNEKYVRPDGNRACRRVYMHREIVGLYHGDKRQVDHINRDKLDCRRENLCVAPRGDKDNRQNLGIRCDNKSGFRGVSWHKATRRWRANVQLDGRQHYLGLFTTPEAADAVARAFRAVHMPFSEDAR